MTIEDNIDVPPSAEESQLASSISEPKLWAGKYKSAEELESAYKNNVKAYNENVELKKQLEQITKTPDDYQLPSDIALREAELNEIKTIAKNAGLNQSHFEKVAREMEAKFKSNIERFEQAKTEVGEEKLNVLSDYVKRNYPESLHEHVMAKLIQDKTAQMDALKHRDQILNSKIPGIDRGNYMSQAFDGEKELKEAAKEFEKNPNERTKARYIKLATETGMERYKDQLADMRYRG